MLFLLSVDVFDKILFKLYHSFLECSIDLV